MPGPRQWAALMVGSILAAFSIRPTIADDMIQISRCVEGSLLFEHLLEKEYVADDFHIFYSLQGPDAIKFQYDSLGDGVPDRIKDIATQLQAARFLYSTVLGLRFPLQQKIYTRARQINVYIITLPKGNGVAFDRVASEKMSNGVRLSCGLKVVLNTSLDPADNATPAHELFHLYQYGYAVFKQKWYLEGMARWMENVFRPADKRVLPLAEPSTCERNFSRGYGAASFWASYAQHGFPAITLPDKAMAWRYADGSPVFKPRELPGGKMLQPFFQQLALSSESISREMNLANTRWSEKQQRDGQFNGLICQALADTAIR